MRTIISIFSILTLSLVVACGGSGGDGEDTVDAAMADAMVPAIDATVVPTVADGLACAPTQEDPSGGCPATHLCLNSKCHEGCALDPATMMASTMVCPGFSGPGVSACLASVSANGMAPFSAAACLIVCEDTTGVGPGCPTCDGTCPNTFTCLQHPSPGAPQGLKICQ